MRTEETQNSGVLINERAWEAKVVRMGRSQIPRARIQITVMGKLSFNFKTSSRRSIYLMDLSKVCFTYVIPLGEIHTHTHTNKCMFMEVRLGT